MIAEPNPHEFVRRTADVFVCASVLPKSARARKWPV